jgi:hypothetical protein
MESQTNQPGLENGIHGLLPAERMTASARKLRDAYARTPGAPLFQREFGLWMCMDRWYEQGLPRDANLDEFFSYDPAGHFPLDGLGWCEAAFDPPFEEKILEDRGDHELVQDFAGRKVLFFKGRRQGFMPEYVDHPVKDRASWIEYIRWRLDPGSSQRWADRLNQRNQAVEAAGQGLMIQQRIIGPYMYLRSLIGPEGLLYAFYDQPDLIHDCLRQWLVLADAVTAFHQQTVTLDELFFAEDICYNHGPLISPDMIREFLFPYYQPLISNIQSRQIDKKRHLYIQIDTDGFANPVIDVYRDGIGMDVMSPFEVASGCDVIQIGQTWPELILCGGIDKRILYADSAAIDRYLESLLPAMKKRGGDIPTCDHGVPEDVPLKTYLHFRKRCIELGQ